MNVRVQFFSRLRDVTGIAEIELKLTAGATVNDLLAALYARFPELAEWDAHILTAVGVEYVGRHYELRPADTVAVMPPVQGG